MNDFTIEELFIIRSLINSNNPELLTSSAKVMLVQSKVQSMIDDYCEHEKNLESMIYFIREKKEAEQEYIEMAGIEKYPNSFAFGYSSGKIDAFNDFLDYLTR